jgi:hypothetical protein
LLTRFDHAESGVSLWFEDDGRVAYAYLRRGDALAFRAVTTPMMAQ